MATPASSRRSSASQGCCAPTRSRNIWSPKASRSGARISPPTTGATFRHPGSTISQSSAWAKGKGILLLHDFQARTVAALPRILETMKARGYRIVHVVPATPERPATPTEPQQWLLHPPPDAIAQWPEVPNFVFANHGRLPVPARVDFDATADASLLRQVVLSHPSWPEPSDT